MELTILMPCLNEALTVASCVRDAREYLEATEICGEILVADNGSTDGSADLAAAAGARVLHVETRGYGAALIAGIDASKGRFVIMGDADQSYDFRHLDGFLRPLRLGCQLVIGNRFAGSIAPGAMPFMNRYVGNPLLSYVGRRLFSSPVGDFHCGIRGFDRAAIQSLRLRSPGMEFASEMVVKASLRRLTIAEVPTDLRPDGRHRPPHLRPWRDGWRHLRFMLLRSPRWLFLYPGLVLAALGTLIAAWVAAAPRPLLGITLDINALLYACIAVIVGLQIAYFGLFASVFANKLGPRRDHAFTDRAVGLAAGQGALVAGLGFILAGLGAASFAVVQWGHASFGALLPSHIMRLTIPAVTSLAIGTQILFGALLLGFVDLE